MFLNSKISTHLRNKFGLVILLSSLLVSSQAHAFGLSVTGGATKDTQTSSFGFGVGGLLDFHVVDRLSFETGAMYLDNKFTDGSEGSIYIPATLNLHLISFLTIGAGGYYNHYTSDGIDADYGYRIVARLGGYERLFIDASYSGGLHDYGGGDHIKTLMLMLGFHLGML